MPTMEVILVTQICPHTLAARPFDIQADRPVTIDIGEKTKDIMLTVDGQVGEPLDVRRSVVVSRAEYQFKLVNPFGWTFFSLLHSRLKWVARAEESSEDESC